MHVRVSVDQDTFLCRRLGDSPGVARQVRPRKRGCLSKSTSCTVAATPADGRPPSYAQDADSVNFFQPFFWLVFDDPNVRKRHPEARKFTVHVPDLPQVDGNVGLEEMMRGVGLSTTDGKDSHHEPPPPTDGTEPSKNAGNAAPEGYKTVDVRVEWARTSLLSSYLLHTYSRILIIFSLLPPSIQ